MPLSAPESPAGHSPHPADPLASARERLIVALDVPDSSSAVELVSRLEGACTWFKVGLELFVAAGPAVLEPILARGYSIFLDLKFHDIPNTVAGAVRSAARLGARLLTVHASGGAAMLGAARQAADEVAGGACGVLAVTVLTSLDVAVLGAAWGRSDALEMEREVLRLADLAAPAEVPGIVCRGAEVSAVRARFGDRLAPLVPGIR